jgi:DNA-directed RNA polymerase specialized sigma subunit
VDVSLQQSIGGTEGLTLEDTLTDGVDTEGVCVEKVHYESVLSRLDEIMPQAREIGNLRIKGMSDRAIAQRLGISRTSMYRLLAKAQAELLNEFEEI